MKRRTIIRQRIIKIVNSRLHVEIRDGFLCDKDLQYDLGASTRDVNAIIAMTEKFFKIAIEDDQIDRISTVNQLIDFVKTKSTVDETKFIVEYN